MSKSRWVRKLRPLAPFFLLAGCATMAAAETPTDAERVQGDVLLYGKWAVGCDNLRVCTAVALLRESEAGEPPVHVRMTFTDQISDAQSIEIRRDDVLIEGLSPLAAHKLQEQLLDSTGGELVHMVSEAMHYDVPREGYAEVAGLLGEWRTLPPQQMRSAEVVTPLSAPRIDKPVVPRGLRGIAKRCPKGHMGQSLQAWQLIGGSTLWRAGCGNEGLNSVSFWFASGLEAASPKLIKFADKETAAQPYNSWFDESSGYLRMIHYFGHWESFTDDCGIYRAYAFSGGKMTLVEKRYMPQCGTGIGPEGWVRTYHATILNGPDSGP